ncbi:FtsX-like permease family protein [Haloechinothrix halophila]|uniref:FtsX-like permease family protein n=1 Tax=Haloechinothrix halophila TaxID=1069073 RepID=UPI00041230E3|nr:FtsX-like permease family protein [Haloechinothrix halophila]
MTPTGGGNALTQWWRDVSFGFRLALGVSRNPATALLRLAVGAFGVAMAVALLLGAASMVNIVEQHEAREAQQTEQLTQRPGVDPLYVQSSAVDFRDERILGSWVYASGNNAPVPPGLSGHLEPGQLAVSPALGELLDSPEGAPLRKRFDDLHRVGTIGKAGVVEPRDLRFYVGAEASLSHRVEETKGTYQPVLAAYGFGGSHGEAPLPIDVITIIVVGVVTLLFPILILIGASTRIAGAERDRRLAAIRLVGASARRVRRISAAESMVPAVLGLLLGGVLFLLARPVVAEFEFFGYSAYASDIVPSPVLVALIVCVVPVLAITSALVAQRRLIVEPLGVVRQATARRRRLWWRLLLFGAGLAILAARPWGMWLASMFLSRTYIPLYLSFVVLGVLVMLLGLAALLPWAVERTITRLDRGGPSWQLAIRRLQFDSGTSARVFSGLALALVSGVAVQVLVSSYEYTRPDAPEAQREVVVETPPDAEPALTALRQRPDVETTGLMHRSVFFIEQYERAPADVLIAECSPLLDSTVVSACQDGDVFLSPRAAYEVRPGDDLVINEQASRWTVPRSATTTELEPLHGFSEVSMVVTPSALGEAFEHIDSLRPMAFAVFRQEVDNASRAELVEYIQSAYGLSTTPPEPLNGVTMMGVVYRDIGSIGALLTTSLLFVLGVAVLGVLVTSAEHLRERARALSSMSASGVGFGALARSLLWQNAIPLALVALLAVVGGGLLAAVLLLDDAAHIRIGWAVVALPFVGAVVLSLLLTALSLPALRAAVSTQHLRTE